MRKMFARRLMWAKKQEEQKKTETSPELTEVVESPEVLPELNEVVEEVKEKKTRKKKSE